MKFLGDLFRKIPVKLRWPAFILIAVISFGSFISINSYWADTNNLNTLLHIVGFVFAAIAVGIFAIAVQESKEQDERRIR